MIPVENKQASEWHFWKFLNNGIEIVIIGMQTLNKICGNK